MPFIGASAQVTLLDLAKFFVFSLEDASAPGVSIETKVPTKPYGNPIQVTFTTACVQNHVYTIKVWESVDSSPTGVVRCSYSVTVTVNSVFVRLPLYAEVDITAGWVSGTSTVVDSSLVGWDYILRRNPAYLVQDTHSTFTTLDKYTKNTDGFTLVGNTLSANEQWILEFVPQIVAAQPGVPSSPFGTGRIVTTDTTFTNSDKNQCLLLEKASGAAALNLKLPVLSTVTDFTDVFYFMSDGGSQKNSIIACQVSDKIKYQNDVTSLTIGQAETIGFFKAFGKYRVIHDTTGIRSVGELLYNYNDKEINTLVCNGSVKNRADYPRLWAFVQDLSTGVVSESTWNNFVTIDGVTIYPNRCNFSLGDGSTTFRLPLLTNIMLKGVDGSVRVPGSFENHAMIDHQHEGTAGTLPTTLFGRGATRVVGTYGGSASGSTDLTSKPVNSSGTLISAIGAENLVKNAGAYLLIRI
jgi:hypothetical protein